MAWSDSDVGSFMTLCDNRDGSDTEFSGLFLLNYMIYVDDCPP